jgi:hypothetical protein
MKMYLGLIKYRPNVIWMEVYKLIEADSKENAELKLRNWADKNIVDRDLIITISETL